MYIDVISLSFFNTILNQYVLARVRLEKEEKWTLPEYLSFFRGFMLHNCWFSLLWFVTINVRENRGHSRMDNPETLATLSVRENRGQGQSRDTGNIER